MKYAISREAMGKSFSSWTVKPWKLMGLKEYDTTAQIPDDAILIASHYAPWWSPLKEYINEGRPWIEIDYGYWGARKTTRRVTYNGHHNLKMSLPPFSRRHLFPQMKDWNTSSKKEYILGILPHPEILKQRTSETIMDFQIRLSDEINQNWDGPIIWREKKGNQQFETLSEQVKNAYAVVGERTMACVQACLLGVPAFTIDNSMTSLLMGDFENLKKLAYPDRQNWFEHICWSQFREDEFDSVIPAKLTEQYQIEK